MRNHTLRSFHGRTLSSFVAALFVGAALCLFVTGCTTAPTASPASGGTATATGTAPAGPSPIGLTALRFATSTTATLSLAKNPAYAPFVADLDQGIEGALTGTVEITPAQLLSFVTMLAAKNNVPMSEATLYAGLAANVYRMFVGDTHAQVVLSTDPRFKPYIQAFKDGLDDALAPYGLPVPLADAAPSAK